MLDSIFAKIERFVPAKWSWILSHAGFKKYFANTGWMFLGQIGSLVVAFFIGAWIARYLGPENYGVLNYALSFAGLFGFLSALGVDAVLNRELVKYPEKRDELLGTGFYLKLVGGLIAFFAASLAAWLFKVDGLVRVLAITFSLSFIFQALGTISFFFQAGVQAKKNVQAQLFATLISSVLKIAVILFGGGVFWLTLIYAFDALWQGIILINIYNASGFKLKDWRFNRELAWQLWHNSWPLMLSSAVIFIYMRIDQVIVGHLLGKIAVGYYAAAVKLTEVWCIIPSIICASLFPAIINAKKSDAENYRRRLNHLYILLISLAFLIAVFMTIFGPLIVRGLFGPQYQPTISILRIYIWSGVSLFWGWAVSQYLISENLVQTIFIIHLTAMAVNIGLNFLLIPLIGLTGAAYATLVSYSIVPVMAFSFRRYFSH